MMGTKLLGRGWLERMQLRLPKGALFHETSRWLQVFEEVSVCARSSLHAQHPHPPTQNESGRPAQGRQRKQQKRLSKLS